MGSDWWPARVDPTPASLADSSGVTDRVRERQLDAPGPAPARLLLRGASSGAASRSSWCLWAIALIRQGRPRAGSGRLPHRPSDCAARGRCRMKAMRDLPAAGSTTAPCLRALSSASSARSSAASPLVVVCCERRAGVIGTSASGRGSTLSAEIDERCAPITSRALARGHATQSRPPGVVPTPLRADSRRTALPAGDAMACDATGPDGLRATLRARCEPGHVRGGAARLSGRRAPPRAHLVP
jgi:hypothetical protein